MALPVVSVILPTMNMLHLLENTVKGIALAADLPFEIILINNASTDNSKDWIENVAEGILKQNPNFIKLIKVHNPINRFLSGAINQGFLLSSGKRVVICANDILIPKSYFSWADKKLDENPNIGALSPWYTELPQVNTFDTYYPNYDKIPKIDEWTFNWSFSVLQMLTRELIDKVGPFDECLESSCQDNDFGVRMYLAGYRPTAWKGMVCSHIFGSFGRGAIKNERKVSTNDSRYFHWKWGVYTDKGPDDVSLCAKKRAEEGNYISNRQKNYNIKFGKIKIETHGRSLFS